MNLILYLPISTVSLFASSCFLTVLEVDLVAAHRQHGVLPAHGEVVDHDVVVGPATQRRPVLGQLHFLDDDTVDRDDHLRHGPLLFEFIVIIGKVI